MGFSSQLCVQPLFVHGLKLADGQGKHHRPGGLLPLTLLESQCPRRTLAGPPGPGEKLRQREGGCLFSVCSGTSAHSLSHSRYSANIH